MENVLRVNRGIEEEIGKYRAITIKAISKLQEPFGDRVKEDS